MGRATRLLIVLGLALACTPGWASPKPERKALPSGGHELRYRWQLRHGVRVEQVVQFNKDGHRTLSSRDTFGKSGRVTYRHTSYNADGSVRERGIYKVWRANGVRLSSSKRFDPRGRLTSSCQTAEGPGGKSYERQLYPGFNMVDVTKEWTAKGTRFQHYSRTFRDSGRTRHHRMGWAVNKHR